MLTAAVAAAEPESLVAARLHGSPELLGADSVVVLAVGKAALGMARGVRRVLGEGARGIVVTPDPKPLPPFLVIAGDHPIPSDASFAAGDRLLAAAQRAGPDEVVLALVSGGASALAEVPAPGFTPAEIAKRTSELLVSGRAIEAINEERTTMSLLKGGGLTRGARPARVVTLAISDVVGSDPAAIGSGPTLGCDAYEVIGDGASAAAAAAAFASASGLSVEVIADPVTGPARDAGEFIGRKAAALPAGAALVAWGETTVHVTGKGRGGRNQELALAAALQLSGTAAVVAALGSDGIDGPTRNAGAVVDGATIARGDARGRDAVAHLEDNDSAAFLEATDDVIVTGPTGTNVGDITVALRLD